MGRYGTTTKHLLEALLPDERSENKRRNQKELITRLANEKEIQVNTLRNAFHRAIKAGLISVDDSGVPLLTQKGRHTILPFVAPTLPGSVLMVIFDIAEADRPKRDHLRTLLKELSFQQVQKSVWCSKLDHREYLKSEIAGLNLENAVVMYEANPL